MSADEVWESLMANYRAWLAGKDDRERELALRGAIVNVNSHIQPGYGSVSRADLEARTSPDFTAIVQLRIHNRALSGRRAHR